MAVLWHLAGGMPPAVAQGAPEAGARKGSIRVGCGVLADSQGRSVSQQAGDGGRSHRPSYCPENAPAPKVEAIAEAQAAPQHDAPDVPQMPEVQVAEPPATSVLRPAPKPRARAAAARPAVRVEPPARVTGPAPTAPPVLESSRTTHAFGEPPSLRLDPVGAGLALLTSGTLWWFLRSGFAASLLLLGLPVWRDVDLLPVVTAGTLPAGRDHDADADDDAQALLATAPPPAT